MVFLVGCNCLDGDGFESGEFGSVLGNCWPIESFSFFQQGVRACAWTTPHTCIYRHTYIQYIPPNQNAKHGDVMSPSLHLPK